MIQFFFLHCPATVLPKKKTKLIYMHYISGNSVHLIHHIHITHHRSSPPSSWSAQFWPSSCSLSACSSSRGSQTRWHPDGNPPPHTSWTTARCPLQGLSMPCSPGRRLDTVTVDWVSIHYKLASLNLFVLNEGSWLPNGLYATWAVGLQHKM